MKCLIPQVFSGRGEIAYYQDSASDKPQATIALNNVDWCRKVDGKEENGEFEFLTGTRLFRWRTKSQDSMQEWINAIQDAKAEAEARLADRKRDQVRANTSDRVKEFDDLGSEEEQTEFILGEIDTFFGWCAETQTDLATKAADMSQAVDLALDDLHALSTDCIDTQGQRARTDILLAHLRLFNDRVLEEISPFMGDDRTWETKGLREDYLEDLGEADNDMLYTLIILIRKYTVGLSDLAIVLPEEDRPTTPLYSIMSTLSERFVSGPKGANARINDICLDAAQKQIREGKISQGSDGLWYTSTVVDIWTVINKQMDLAVETQSPSLTARIATGILDSLYHMMRIIGDNLRERDVDENELNYVCATLNDSQKHIENISAMTEETLNYDEVQEVIQPKVDRAYKELGHCGDIGVHLLARMVMHTFEADNTFAELFGPAWVSGESQVEKVTATLDDYIEEFSKSLVEYYLNKVALDMAALVTIESVRALDKSLREKGKSSLMGVFRSKTIKLDETNIPRIIDDIECLEGVRFLAYFINLLCEA